jgi:hypothetical protein
MVMQQRDRWPDTNFSPSKTTVKRLKHVLLNGEFTKEAQVASDVIQTEEGASGAELRRTSQMVPRGTGIKSSGGFSEPEGT